ncbi:uncharacterized protein RCO7_10543 [Rhynchosporium graminicola]|uniref:FAR1 domain-containing protein n=1 Tax=Rhynchosporium graminicola TaxID=2792576 RepID=A0A1E1K5Z7_9HELO|nr:uncharacterized protein RCO7_10543 [Rhynchosporium commune]
MASILTSCGPAPPVAIYSDIQTGFTAIQAHARAYSYTLRQRDIRLFRALFICDRAGKYDPKGKQSDVDASKRRKNTRSKKCDCQMRVTLIKDRASEQWEVKVLEATHNHAASADITAYLAYRIASLPAETRVTISSLAKAGVLNAQILSALREEAPGANISLLSKDISNLV